MALTFAVDAADSGASSETPVGARLDPRASRDPRALGILAKSIYRELRQGGLAEEDVMKIAGDLLGLIAGDVKGRRLAAHTTETRR